MWKHDAHDCPGGGTACSDSTILSNADQWLQNNIAPLLSNPAFQQDGLLLIWWDEGNGSVIAYNVTASHTGWFIQTKSVTVASGVTATLNFALATSGKVGGTVTNSSGGAISSAAVKITGGSITTTVNTTTNSTGGYNSDWVPVGTYTVTVTATGFTTQSQTVSVNTGVTITLNFTMHWRVNWMSGKTSVELVLAALHPGLAYPLSLSVFLRTPLHRFASGGSSIFWPRTQKKCFIPGNIAAGK